ncbi:SURP and G-patch domain-containing protein 2-like [Pleurodeles waltl]|uniref:SURP and G-patch domain-containing protein 2-like n=1 Tax=Pleurodeles waltl TaxID=8319 RepID=UPI0037096030
MADKQVSREIFEAIMKEMVGTFRPSSSDDPFRAPGPSRSRRYEDDFEAERYRSPRDDYRGPESRRPAYSTPARRSPPPYYPDPQRSRSPLRPDDYYYSHSEPREFPHPREPMWSDDREYRRPPRRDGPFPEESFAMPGPTRGYGRPDAHASPGRLAYLERRQAAGLPVTSPRGGLPIRRPLRGGVVGRGPIRGGVVTRGLTRGLTRGGFVTRGVTRGAAAVRSRGALVARGRGSKAQAGGRGAAMNGKKPGPKREDKIKELMSGSDVVSKLGSKIVRWSGFNKVNTGEFDQKNRAYTSMQTQTMSNTLAAFKCALRPELRYQCFLTVKAPNHPALKKPTVDPDLFSMLLEKGLVENKKAFLDIIQPLDRYLTSFQQCVLKSAHPLMLACNAYELNMKQGFSGATDLSTAYENAVALCRKALVLFGQTNSIVASLRQEKILEHIGLQEMAPKPSDFPNMEDSTLFGKKYMAQLKAWLEKSGYPMHLQHERVSGPKEPLEDLTPDPAAKEIIDDLLEDAVKTLEDKKKAAVEGDTEMADREKPELWFLFDEASHEFKYYQHKLLELQKHQQADVEAKRAQLKVAAAVSLVAKSAGPSKPSTDPQFDEVDDKTRQTAENLARFVFQLGSNIEDFNMDSLTSNPDFWFLTKKDCPAHKFYEMKLTEFREGTESGDAETKDTEAAQEEETEVTNDAEQKDTEETAENDESEPQKSQEATDVECDSTKGSSGTTSTPAPAAQPQRKRGAAKARTATPKKASVPEEPKADDPVKTGNERPTGRAGLRKKQKLAEDDHGSVETPTKGGAASGDEDLNEDSLDATE